MDRRDFLKGTVGFSIAGMTALLLQPGNIQGVLAASPTLPAVQASVLGRLLQGTSDGLIFESLDSGKSWQQIAKFGQHCAITSIRETRGQAHVTISTADRHFEIKSTDVRLWHLVS